ncbi:MAG: Nif3-like dinuclear metal center hexameric protein [Eubacteriales bacterium]
MTVRTLYDTLSALIPPTLSIPGDNDGLAVCPDASREVRRVLCVLDVTEAAVAYALQGGFDTILSHHPLLYRPAPSLTQAEPLGRKLIRLLAGGISVMSFHTRADAVAGGTNDRLAALVGLTEVTPICGEGEASLVRGGRLPRPLSLAEFAALVKQCLHVPPAPPPMLRAVDSGRMIARVAVCGGTGRDFVKEARAWGADLYLAGELGYHTLLDEVGFGMSLMEAGHDCTEAHMAAYFAERVRGLAPDAEVCCWQQPSILQL